MTFRELLGREFPLSAQQLETLEKHYNLLSQWNRKLNLTRIERLEDAVHLHYGESLFLAEALPEGPHRIVDVGSGAGFPGIPVAIRRPESSVTLVESHQRKAVFLREASRDLPNVQVFAGRAEDLKGSYDWVTARAVTPADVLKLRLAPRAALLMSEPDLEGLTPPDSVLKIPGSERRVVAMFNVPRGT
ncbi:MAG TPA: 16S rRNA (guanine(527)-N(7))-methyltransferase RsmG [Bryobacteraceae bacterium]|nr:16S rRNA (guanine(527)-N(7))-methyltransferase RsmG [Bryobacteraceae bacterium]